MYDYLNLDAFVAISGGLDSAIVAVACAKALGTDRLRLVTMPSRANGTVTLGAAAHVAEALGLTVEPELGGAGMGRGRACRTSGRHVFGW